MICIIEHCLFSELSSSLAGTGISLSGYGDYEVKNCVFYKCSSSKVAPGLHVNTAHVNMKKLCFSECSAPQNPAVLYNGIPERETVFNQIAIELSKTTSTDSQYGAPFNIIETNAILCESNITANTANHIGAAQNKQSGDYSYKYCHIVGNTALNGGVILQFNLAPATKLSYINLISNQINTAALFRAVSNTDTVSITTSNFILNSGTLFTGPITFNSCYYDASTSSSQFKNPLNSSIDIKSKIINCNYIPKNSILCKETKCFFGAVLIFIIH